MANKILRDSLMPVLMNASAVQRLSLAHLTEIAREKIDPEFAFVDPSNPVVATIETCAHQVAAGVEKARILTRRQNSRTAQDTEDLYVHMKDIDYLDRFAQPAQTTFDLVLSLAELRNNMIDDPSGGYKKVVIPRNTVFVAMDYYFSLSYPVEIREMNYGGIVAVYITDQFNPVQELSTNQVPMFLTSADGVEYIRFNFEVLQYRIQSFSEVITAGTSFTIRNLIKDEFFFIRVWNEQPDGTWKEIRTTHSDLYYDPEDPTAVVKVTGKIVEVSIPTIYTHSKKIIGRIRADVYETLGPINVDLGGFGSKSTDVSFISVDKNEDTPYTAVLSKLRFKQAFSNKYVVGGRPALSFEELRRRVIMNDTGSKRKPISPDQIKTTLSDKGYTIVKTVENLTDRIFLASRLLPKPRNEKLITAAALSIQSSVFKIDNIRELPSVIDNGNSVTILPEAVFQFKNGLTSMVTQYELDELAALSNDQKAIAITNGGYYYSPFHYVLDFSRKEFSVRPYYLGSPEIIGKFFMDTNPDTGMTVTITSYTIEVDETGYLLLIQTKGNDTYRKLEDHAVHVQLAFFAQGESERAHLLGEQVAVTEEGDRTFAFHLDSRFYMTDKDGITFNNFQIIDPVNRKLASDLDNKFEVLFSTSEPMDSNWKPRSVDDAIGKFQLPLGTVGITNERLHIKFGESLDMLWKRARNFLGTSTYRRYEEDVFKRYEKDVYFTDPVTGFPIIIENGEVTQNVKHKKGDIATNADGSPIILHYRGDLVKDETGAPIEIDPRQVEIQMDFLLVEGAYIFSNDPVVRDYRSELTNVLVQWIAGDLKDLSPELLEKTYVYFYPKATTGNVSVMFGAGLTTTINASQSLRVDLHVDDRVDSDDKLKQQIRIKTIDVINRCFDSSVISNSDITAELRTAYAGDVINVQFSGLGGMLNNYQTVSLLSETDRLSIGKRLKARPDGVLMVEENIHFNFIRHRLDKPSEM